MRRLPLNCRSVLAAGLLAAGLCLAFGTRADAVEDTEVKADSAAGRTLNVLFIGNSYTGRHNLAELVKAMAEAGNPDLRFEVSTVIYGGRRLVDHWRLGTQNIVNRSKLTVEQQQATLNSLERMIDQDPEDSHARVALRRHRELLASLDSQRKRWDIVVLQSYRDDLQGDRSLYVEYAPKFAELIRAQGGRVVLYETTPTTQNATPLETPPEREPVLQKARTIAALARRIDATVVPMSLVALRCQTQRPDLTLRFVNDAHLNQTLAYLTACTFYGALFDRSPEGLPINAVTDIRFLDDEHRDLDRDGGPLTRKFSDKDRADLQRIAWQGLGEFRELLAAAQDDVLTPVGLHAVAGLPADCDADSLIQRVRMGNGSVYFQSPSEEEVAAVRNAAEAAGLLGTRVFVDQGDFDRIHLADNLADTVIASAAAIAASGTDELLRVIHPRGKVLTPDGESTKPVPEGVDTWSHLYHGPDNNPRSQDHTARAPYLTQFLADPLFCPMPEVSVAGGGRVYRAFGHIAHKANQNPMLNKLICVNAYNGTILWTRALSAGFMIHRCTMIATDDVLYLADDQSCKRIDGATGRVLDEIVVPDGMGDGRVWKWMALVDGVLYALVGAEEIHVDSQPSQVRGLGHWPWGMWQGHDYADPRTSFGYGRTFVAFDVATREVLWSHDETEYLDSRGVCMSEGRIFYYAPDRFLGCLGVDGQVDWKSDNADLLAAIGSHGKAQHYVTGYATTSYIKSNRDYILFAGPQRNQLVVARAADGQLLWAREPGNLQLVLEQDGFYAAGPQQPGAPGVPENGAKLAYEDGRVLARLPMRRACTRATGTDDSIFYRASGGTVRLDKATNQARHIAPMRPPCQDGVIVSDGNLYWGPWMCGCQLSLYGHIALTSAGDFEFCPPVDEQRLTTFSDGSAVQPLEIQANDWPAYQADNSRSATTQLDLDSPYAADWEFALSQAAFPTAPIAAGDRVFFGDRNGFVYALNAADGQQVWRAATGGAIFFPPALHEGRLFVGSADGRVYAFEAVTGRRLWTFRAAPAERWIPVYGRLTSTWPVAGGVVVDNGVVYAAAGIAHYDGTHVFALDAETGAVKWSNDRSGTTSEQADHGVSLQGVLSIRDGELRFAGGGVHEEARYDLSSGECLNESDGLPRSRFHTAFYAHFPDYGKYVSLETPLEDGRYLCYDCTYEGSWHSSLTLQPAGAARGPKPLSRWGLQGRRGAGGDRGLEGRLFGGFVVGRKAALAAGHADGDDPAESSLISIGLEQADPRWSLPLGGPVVKGGLAVNARGQVFVSLENGQIRAFSAAARTVPPAS